MLQKEVQISSPLVLYFIENIHYLETKELYFLGY